MPRDCTDQRLVLRDEQSRSSLRYPILMTKKITNGNKPKQNKPTQRNPTRTGMAMRGLGELIGATLGHAAGGPLGSIGGGMLGNVAGAGVSYITGNGDYKVNRNSLALSPNSTVPSMHKINQTVTIRHKEYLGPITGSTNFQVQKRYSLNPGLAGTFPWLSGIATQYEQYAIKGMVFQYVPTSGSFTGNSSALGVVMIQTAYRATEDEPIDKQEMLNEYWSTETVANMGTIHPIECSPKENPFQIHYVRSEVTPPGEILMYDLAKTFVATQGMDNTGVVGDLWVSYEIEFKKPIVRSNAVISNKIFYAAKFQAIATPTNYFGTNQTEVVAGDALFTCTNRSLTLPPGETTYLVVLTGQFYDTGPFATFTGTSWNVAPILTGCTLVTVAGKSWQATIGGSPTASAIGNMVYSLYVRGNSSLASTVTFPSLDGTYSAPANYRLEIMGIEL